METVVGMVRCAKYELLDKVLVDQCVTILGMVSAYANISKLEK